MTPSDPRLNTLRARAAEWERSLYWIDEPAEFTLEIIPPTPAMGAMCAATQPSPAAPTSCPPSGVRRRYSTGDTTGECRALAYLAGELLNVLSAA